MDLQTLAVIGVVLLALGLVIWLPMRKQWNADGAVDDDRENLDEEE